MNTQPSPSGCDVVTGAANSSSCDNARIQRCSSAHNFSFIFITMTKKNIDMRFLSHSNQVGRVNRHLFHALGTTSDYQFSRHIIISKVA